MVRKRYLEKIDCIGIDPVLLQGKNFNPDCLPPVKGLRSPRHRRAYGPATRPFSVMPATEILQNEPCRYTQVLWAVNKT